MKEEEIDNRIERIVKSVAAKKAEMTKWETERKSPESRRAVTSKHWRTYGISAAASVVVICSIGIGLYMNRTGNTDYYGVTSSAPIYRSGSADIDEIKIMIDSAKYQEALQAIDATMEDTIIDPTYAAERQKYLRSVYKNQLYELTWLKIQVLVKLKKEKEAIFILEDYVQNEGINKIEARDLLEKLKE